MNILLKDPAKVDAVIEKITKKYLVDEGFVKYCVPSIKREMGKGVEVLLDVDFGYDVQKSWLTARLHYSFFSDIPTDEEFLKDKEW